MEDEAPRIYFFTPSHDAWSKAAPPPRMLILDRLKNPEKRNRPTHSSSIFHNRKRPSQETTSLLPSNKTKNLYLNFHSLKLKGAFSFLFNERFFKVDGIYKKTYLLCYISQPCIHYLNAYNSYSLYKLRFLFKII